MSSRWETKTLSSGIRAITGGQGSPVVLIAGWPETAEAWSEIFEPISQHHRFLALDPPGLGESAPAASYDTAAISTILAEAVHAELGNEQYHLVGHDVGAWIAYPWAAQFSSHIKTLTVMDSRIPGVAQTLPFPLPARANTSLFQFSFNAVPELPEILTRGKEREFLTWLIKNKAMNPEGFPQEKLELYIRYYSDPGVMSRGFDYYRAVELSGQQNLEFVKTPLTMPVLALGGAGGAGSSMGPMAKVFASNVSAEVLSCGHFLAEEQPEVLSQKLLSFFAGSNA